MVVQRVVSWISLWISVVLLAFLAVCALAAQSTDATQAGNPPQFRSGISVLRLDASVVDDGGRAIGDLRAEDFQVTLDGRPRRVVSARFTGTTKGRAAGAQDAVMSIPSYVVNTGMAGGRAIVLMVDLESIDAGSERPLLDTAAQLAEKLRPVDAVAVVPLPGQSVDLTREHGKVAAAIRTLRGTSQMSSSQYSFTFDEAVAFERRDKWVMAEVIERECRREPQRAAVGLQQTCPADLQRDTAERLRNERLHIDMVLNSIVAVAKQLRTVPAPASIVLISGGLGFEQGSLGRFQQVERVLRDAGISIVAVQVDQPAVEAATSRRMPASYFASSDLQSGLASIATMAGGSFYAGIGTAKGVFERLRTELTEAYELGVEAEPGDLDGKPHEVRVTTTRKAKVRARRYFASEEPSTDWPAGLAKLIAQPVDVGDLPIAVAAHSIRGDEPTTLKVLIRADISHGVRTNAPVRYAALVLGADNTIVMNITGTAAPNGGVLLSTQLAPGRYRLRMAAIDGIGRAGTLEVPIDVGIRIAGGLQLSDVIIGSGPKGSLQPSIYVSVAESLAAALELSTDDPSRFDRTSVEFEIRRRGSDDVVAASAARLEQTIYERQQIARALIPADALQSGEYVLSGIVKVDGQATGRVSRIFFVEPNTSRTTATGAAWPAKTTPSPSPPAPTSIADPMLSELMHNVAAYVATYGEQMSAVVGIEKYTQYINPSAGTSIRPRQLLAEFALVKSGGLIPWTGYRDVIEVNGEPIRDRRDRIVKILADSADPITEASRLTAESARFNIGPVSRNFNLPTTALFFFHASNLSRFTFTRKGSKQIEGVETLEIGFRETRRPTLISRRDGTDVPSQGTLWVLPEDGTIVRTRLQLKGFADSVAMGDSRPERLPPPPIPQPTQTSPPPPPPPASGGKPPGPSGSGATSGTRESTAGDANAAGLRNRFAGIPDFALTKLESSANIDVTYRRDAKLGMWLPARMNEEYQGAIPRINNPPILGTARSTATYSDYKRFGTSAAVISPKK